MQKAIIFGKLHPADAHEQLHQRGLGAVAIYADSPRIASPNFLTH